VPDEYTAWPVDAVDGLIVTNEIEDKNEIEATLRKFLKKIQKLELKKIVIDPQIDSIGLILENYVVSSLTSAVTINSPDNLK
jgi:hypothetical protein